MDAGPHLPEEAIAVETYVEARRGRWHVSVVVVFPDEVVRKEITSYATERMAKIAASWIKRAAQRDVASARPRIDPARARRDPGDDAGEPTDD